MPTTRSYGVHEKEIKQYMEKHKCRDCEGKCSIFNEILEKNLTCPTCLGMGVEIG